MVGHDALVQNVDVGLHVCRNLVRRNLDLGSAVGADDIVLSRVIAVHCTNVGCSVGRSFNLANGAIKVDTVGENIQNNLHPFKGL